MNTNDAVFLKKLQSTFKIEAYEHIKTISLLLLELENKPTEEENKTAIETIYREFHSLKGAARAVNIKEIETICHTLEGIFSSVKKGKLILNLQMFDIFNSALDTVEDILAMPEDKIKDISKIIEELSKVESGCFINKGSKEFRNKDVSNNIDMRSISQEIKIKDVEISEPTKVDDVIRVSKNKLDTLLIQGEEMLYAKLSAAQRAREIKEIYTLFQLWKKEKKDSYIEVLENNIGALMKLAENDAKTIEGMIDTFIEDVKDIMLLPFSSIIESFPKMVRDLCRQTNKEIELIKSGTEIEVDRRILEEIKDPLIHLIRNCIDHGIEKLEEREKLRKPSKGTISLNITQISSDRVKVEISDDGAGIDIGKVKEKAIKNKLLTEKELKNIKDEKAKMLIFKSGVSTSDIITDISGRGLGLAIVYEKIQKLEGTVTVKTQKQKGTTFTIILPITISSNRGIIIKAAKTPFVIPTGKVEKVMRIKKEEIEVIENMATILVDGYITPIFKLEDVLGLKSRAVEEASNNTISILVVNHMERKVAFSVDEIVMEQEVLVKRFNKQLKRVRNISGATVLGSGEVVPILDVKDLIKSSLKYGNRSSNFTDTSSKDEVMKKSILVVEDSITSRTLLKNILENNGYLVRTAVDGSQGWSLLKSEQFDLVVTDVEMPVMDGFQLTKKIREDSEISEMPVILVTSLESREYKERGVDVGASAYIVKNDFQQSNLLEIIKRLI